MGLVAAGVSLDFGGGLLTMSGLNRLLVGSILVVICPVSITLGGGVGRAYWGKEGKGDDELIKEAAGVRTRDCGLEVASVLVSVSSDVRGFGLGLGASGAL